MNAFISYPERQVPHIMAELMGTEVSKMQIQLGLHHSHLNREIDKLIEQRANVPMKSQDFISILIRAYDNLLHNPINTDAYGLIKNLQDDTEDNVYFNHNENSTTVVISRLRPSSERFGQVIILPKEDVDISQLALPSARLSTDNQ